MQTHTHTHTHTRTRERQEKKREKDTADSNAIRVSTWPLPLVVNCIIHPNFSNDVPDLTIALMFHVVVGINYLLGVTDEELDLGALRLHDECAERSQVLSYR